MKQIILLLVALAFAMSAGAQKASISAALQEKLNKQNERSIEEVCIVLWDQADLESIKHRFDQQQLPSGERAKHLQSILTRHAQSTQKELLQQVHAYKAQNVEQYWIVNMIVAELPLKAVQKLAARKDIAFLMLNHEFEAKLIKPVEMTPSAPKSVGGTEAGLIAINAHKMWALGYTGRGRILYTMDTGIWPDHPALGERFLGYYYPLNRAWMGFDNELPYDKGSSHGTHVTGTVCGLDKATDDTIGVAFNAYFMVSDPIVSNIADIKPYSDFALAFEWAFNPDGDTSTTHDIPDVINNSWGRGPTHDTNLCHSPVSIMLTAIETAGIANIFSAGNEGPGDSTISEPHHISTSLVNTFTIGALSPHDTTYPIASFSSRGPTVCPVTGSLQIKPEVSAPGVNIRSCVDHDNYGTYSGTSMAAPHTSGAILLLKEAFPYLTGEQLMLALYNTAHDLGATGEDNTYGRGIIDVWAAYQLLSQTHTPVPPLSSNYDMAITHIKVPFSDFSCDSIFDIEVVVENKGSADMQNFMLYYYTDRNQMDSIQWNVSIAAGAKDSIVLSNVVVHGKGKLEFFVELRNTANVLELDDHNNHRVARFDIRPEATLPLIEDFEHGLLGNYVWFNSNPDDKNGWATDSCGGIQFGTQSALMSCYQYMPKLGQSDMIISPVIELPSTGSVYLTFKYAYSMRHALFPDTFKVHLLSQCSMQQQTLLWKKGGDSLSTVDIPPAYFVPDMEADWKKVTIDLSQHAGLGKVMLAFESANRAGNNIWIDEVKVYEGTTEPVSIRESEANAFKVYPNPTSQGLYLELETGFSPQTQIRVLDMNGKILIQKQVSEYSQKLYLNTQDLPKGMYMIHMVSEQSAQQVKVIKL